MDSVEISLIVPTLNEAANLPALAERVHKALAGRSYEMRIVDDNSKDNTVEVAAELAKTYPLILMTRTEPKNGLGGAVLHGMEAAKGEYLVVMDADLQHPPEKVPELLAPLEKNEADFVIGSRYVAGGTTQGEWGLFRQINSQVATLLARPFAGKTLDPMSGFFALKQTSFENAENLTPLGYKIGLELMCKCRVRRVKEIPITFATREKGESKLSMKEQFRYLEHLSRLYDFCYPRLSPIMKFAFVSLVCWFVGLGMVSAYLNLLRPVETALLAYGVSLGITMIFHVRYIRTQREFIVDRNPWFSFILISGAELAVVWLTSWWMQFRISEPQSHPFEFWSIVFSAGILVRYVLRKELLQDIRGLRKDMRVAEMKHS